MRAEIVDSGIPWLVGARIVIDAPAAKIFALVANPKMHPVIDGSNMVQGEMVGPEKLELGSVFWMKMRRGLPYVMKNKVVEFEQDKLIAWTPLARNIWRYEFRALDGNRTEVTEWMDGRTAPKVLMKREVVWSPKAMAKSLVNLKKLAEQV